MKCQHRPWLAILMAASILVSGLGSGAAKAAQPSFATPLRTVTFEGAPFSQTDGEVTAPALADLAPDAVLHLLVRLDAPSLYQVLDQVEANTAQVQDTSLPLGLEAIDSIHGQLLRNQDTVVRGVEAAGGKVIERLQTTSNALHVAIRRDKMAALAAVPGIRSMGRMPTFQLHLGDARPHIGATKVAEELGFTGKGTTIAVIDTGIDYMHIALGGHGDKAKRDADDDTVIEEGTFPTAKVVGGWDFVGFLYNAGDPANSEPKPDVDPIDDGGHGSHVAGISASQGGGKVDKGIAPDAKLVSLKVFGAGGSTNITAGAMEWVANHNLYLGKDSDKVPGTRPATKIDVINMSLGAGFGGGTLDYEEVVESLIEHDVTVVASAGNSGPTPYIVGSPSATEKVLSVANSVAPGESALALKVNWTADGSAKEELYDALEGAEWMAQLATTGVRKADLAYYGLACSDAEGNPSAPEQDVNEKIALIARGTCPFYDKLLNAAKKGAIAAVVYSDARPKTTMGCGAPSPCETPVDIPGVMIDNDKGVALQELLLGGTSVMATMDPASKVEQTWLTDTMDDSSSRGPGRFYTHIKPQITAPGHNIFSVANGSGTEGVSFSGTSMSGPAVAGVTALLWERNKTQNLGLKADDIAALAMNYATPVIHRTRNDTGPVEGVTRQGAGLAQAYQSAVAHTLVRSERGLAELSYGVTHVVGAEPTEKTITLTVKNLSDKAASYAVDHVFAFPEEDEEAGISLKAEPSSFTVEGGASAEIEVTLTADPAGVKEWDVYGAAPIDPEERFQEQEVDGYLHITEVDAAGAPVDKGDRVGVPFHTLPMRHSCILPDSLDALYLGQEKDQSEIVNLSNECNNAGRAEAFWALGQDDEESADGDLPATLDIAAVGVRYGDRSLTDGTAAPVLQFGVATFKSSTLAIDSRVSVFIDGDKDGTFDFVVFRLGQGVNALNVFAPAAEMDGVPVPTPDQNQWLVFNDPAFQSVNYTVEDLFASLALPLEVMGADLAFDGTVSFDFAVQTLDDMGDFTPEGQAMPVGDWAPSNALEGGRFHFDQAALDCLTLLGEEDVNWMAPDAAAELEADSGNAKATLTWTCDPVAADAEPMELGILSHYINNTPDTDWSLQEILLGGHEPTPTIYLPIVLLNHDAGADASPAEPTPAQ